MESLIEIFHIDAKLLLAQAVNFGIVFAVLYFFALKPVIAVMRERTKKVEKSLEDAAEIEEKMVQVKEDCAVIITQAKKDASEILAKADKVAEERKKETVDKAREEIERIVALEKAKRQTETAQAIKEIKKEVADLVVLSLEKILGEKIDAKKDREIVEKVLTK